MSRHSDSLLEVPLIDQGARTYDSSVELRVLGTVEVLQDGAPVRLGGPKQRIVLALLVAELGQTVSSDRLIDSLWGETTPTGSRHTLQTYISNLRVELGDVLIRDGGGYRLDLDRRQVDATRFEDEVAAARAVLTERPREAATKLREALSLWRGYPYADQAGTLTLGMEARRLEELRLAAVEDRIEAELALGLHGALVPELEALTVEYPLRERFRSQHMLALYRSGRQAEALRAYQKTRRYLAEEIGIDPSPQLRQLEQQILDQDPALDLAVEPRVETLAFLLTDVEGSTVLWELQPRLMQEAMAEHVRTLTEAVEQAGGQVFKHSGDGVCAVFPNVSRAVEAADAAQLALSSADRAEVPPPRVRMAIDVGEVESRAGDFYGPPLNRCARLMAAGHGGQVLLSAAAHAALSNAPDAGWQARALGEFQFKGLGRAQQVFQLLIAGLPAEFPSLVVDRPPPSLPGFGSGRGVRGYELRDQVGGGDFGVVYRAYQASVGREVAVKVIRPEFVNERAFVRLFEAEAQTVALLEHPHIVALYDYWRDPDGAYLVMRWMRGGSLRQALDRGPWHVETAWRLLEQIGRALGYAHRQGVVHRDLKPSNVLLDEEGNAYLSDFGIAARLADTPEITRPPASSPAYLAPEELRGEPLRVTSDIYAFGLMCFELLSGRRPPMDGSLLAIRDLRSDVPAGVDDVIARATAEEAEARYQSVQAFLAALAEALGQPVAPTEPALTSTRNPYKGLHAFTEGDAPDFFGRDEVVGELLDAVRHHRLVAVVGPSGIGKSSVVRAGLIPALRAGAVFGSQEWLVTDLYPGAYPFEELEAALLRVAVKRPGSLVEEMRRDEMGLVRVTKHILSPQTHLVLVIDQFEELFTLTVEEHTRSLFLEALAALVEDERSRVRVVLTLRADFFDRPLRYPRFGELFRAGMVAVTTPGEEDLSQAVRRPAEGVGVGFEPGVVQRIVSEVQEQPGALPLLQYALTELFDTRTVDLLTGPGYQATGGVIGALATRAEEVYGRLDRAAQDTARQVFLRLVTVSETADDTRRRVQRRELHDLAVEPQVVEQVLKRFGEHRLLTFDRDPFTRGPTVEVAHEALVREWHRLADWITERREDLLLHRRLADAVSEWEDSDQSPDSLLQRGRLHQFETWAGSTDLLLTRVEQHYLEASRVEEDRRRRRLMTRRWSIVAVLAVALIVITSLAFLARDQARVSSVRELAASAVASMADDPQLAMLLALEAVQATRPGDGPARWEAEEALHRAVVASRIQVSLPGVGRSSDWSPDGRFIATAGPPDDPALISIRDSSNGEVVRTWRAASSVFGVSFSPDGSVLATSGDDSAVTLWDPDNGSIVKILSGSGGAELVWGLSFSVDGRQIAALWWNPQPGESTARVFDVDSGEMTFELTGLEGGQGTTPEPAQSTAFSPDGSRLGVALLAAFDDTSGWVWIVDLASGEVQKIKADPMWGVSRVAWQPDGDLLATGSFGGLVTIWQPAAAEPVFTVEPGGSVEALDWSPDGSRFATLTTDGKAHVWAFKEDHADVVMTFAVRDIMQTGSSRLAFSPDGSRLLTSNNRGDVVVWDLAATGDQEWLNLRAESTWYGDVAFSPDGETIVASFPGGTVRIWNSTTGAVQLTLEGHGPLPGLGEIPGVAAVAFSPDGSMVATGGRDTDLKLWSAETGEEIYTYSGHTDWIEDVTFSPDGRLLATTAPFLDMTARIIAVDTGDELWQLAHPAGASEVVFTPDGRHLITGADDGVVRIWDPTTGSLVQSIDVGVSVKALAVSPDGSRLAVGTTDTTASIWELATGTRLITLAGHTGLVWEVAFSPDGSRVATGSGDTTIRIWDTATGITQVVLRGHQFEVSGLAFHPEGSRLASFSPDGNAEVRIWALDLDDLIGIAQEELTRAFTDEECRQYLHLESCPSEGRE